MNADDLSLTKGETIIVLEKNEHGWWTGLSTESGTPRRGFFPKNYVRPKNAPDAPPPPPRPSSTSTAPVVTAAPVASAHASTSGASSSTASADAGYGGRPFSIESLDAFDSLVDRGYAVEFLSRGAESEAAVSVGSRVTANIVAMTWDGSTTEASVFAEGTLQFSVGQQQVTEGLDEALVELRVGDEANVICAPKKAYGLAGQPPHVPPNSHVVYVVRLTAATAPESPRPAEGDSLLLRSEVTSRRVNPKAAGGSNRKSMAGVVLDLEGEGGGRRDGGSEISDDMLARAAASMGLGAGGAAAGEA